MENLIPTAQNRFGRFSRLVNPSVALILANAIPLVGVLLFGWRVFDMVILYWLESALVGFSTLALLFLMPISAVDRAGAPVNPKLLLIPSFVAHFSLFMAAHLFLIIFFLGDPDQGNILWQVGEIFWKTPSLCWPLLSLFLSHGYVFVVDYVFTGKCKEPLRKENVFDVVLLRPYKRIFIMQFTVLLSAGAILILRLPQPMVLAMVTVKIYFDWLSYKKEKTSDIATSIF